MKDPKITEQIENNFKYRAPDENQAKRHESINEALRIAAHTVNANSPNSREKSLAITKLEEARFWANAAIARNPEPN